MCEECVSTIKTLTAKLSAGKMTNDTTIASMVSPQVNETFTVPYSSSVEKQGLCSHSCEFLKKFIYLFIYFYYQ